MDGRVALTVVLAFAAACFYAVSNVLEQSEAQRVPDEYALKVRLLVKLAARRRWLIGFASDVGGYVANAAALAVGAVVFVEPIQSMGLLISLLLGALIEHRPVRASGWLSALVLCGGLSLFLVETSPTGGRVVVPVARWAIAAPAVVVAVLLCLVLARSSASAFRSALLGVAAAIQFSAGVILTKAFVHYLGGGVLAWLPHWEPYVMAIAMLSGFLTAQSAFQAGSLAASVSGIEATQPIVSVILGAVLLDERVAVSTPGQIAAVAVACVAVIAAVVALARIEHRDGVTAPAARDVLSA